MIQMLFIYILKAIFINYEEKAMELCVNNTVVQRAVAINITGLEVDAEVRGEPDQDVQVALAHAVVGHVASVIVNHLVILIVLISSDVCHHPSQELDVAIVRRVVSNESATVLVQDESNWIKMASLNQHRCP